MNSRTLKQLFPNASKSTIDANTNCSPSGAESERPLCNEPLGKGKVAQRDSGKRVVRITSYRVRAVDPDNLCGKWFIDALRYAGIIPDDTEADITYQISQKKVAKKNQEKTLIDIS